MPLLLVTDATPFGHRAVPVWPRKERELALTGFCGMAHTRDHERRRHGRLESLKVWRIRATTKTGESGESLVGDCGGEATTGETKSQAQAWLPRRNRRQAIRRFRPFSWSRASAKLSNLPCRRRSRSRVCAMPQKPVSANSLSFRAQTGTALCPDGVSSVTKRSGVCGQKAWGLWPQKRIGVISA